MGGKNRFWSLFLNDGTSLKQANHRGIGDVANPKEKKESCVAIRRGVGSGEEITSKDD